MTVFDVMAILAALWLGRMMPKLFEYEAFAEMMRRRRPRPHTFS